MFEDQDEPPTASGIAVGMAICALSGAIMGGIIVYFLMRLICK